MSDDRPENERNRTTVYIAMINDRHLDPTPFVFSTPEAAIEYASGKAMEYARTPDDVEVESVEGFLYYARYSAEDDDVWVIAETVDAGDE